MQDPRAPTNLFSMRLVVVDGAATDVGIEDVVGRSRSSSEERE